MKPTLMVRQQTQRLFRAFAVPRVTYNLKALSHRAPPGFAHGRGFSRSAAVIKRPIVCRSEIRSLIHASARALNQPTRRPASDPRPRRKVAWLLAAVDSWPETIRYAG